MTDDEHRAAAPGVAGIPSENGTETENKLKLISASYAEVLDATKHQDDKIGQLLTSISFLTAAVLALAALESGSFVTRKFSVQPFTLPLVLIALAIFLVGVAFSVMLLLTSLSTPLRLPGLGISRTSPKIRWVRGIQGSQMYFFEIARTSLQQWESKWDASASVLTRERVDSLIKETHNLGLRTSAKYDRTTEAVSLLSMSLFAFVLAIVFVAIVASSPQDHKPIHLSLWQHAVIAAVFAGYFWLQLIGRIRYNRQAVNEAPPRGVNAAERRRFLGELWYANLVAILIAAILMYGGSWLGRVLWAPVTIGLAFVSAVSFWFATSHGKPVQGEPSAAARSTRRRRQLMRVRWMLTGLIAALTAVGVYGGLSNRYAYQLGAASLAVLCLIAASVLQPTLRLRENRRNYWDQVQPPP